MGKAAAPGLTQALLAAGLPGDTPVALVENASLPGECVIETRIDLLPIAARGLGDGPAIILVGQALRQQTRQSARHPAAAEG